MIAPLEVIGLLWMVWLVGWALASFTGFFVKAKQEESLLLERFGPEYEKYRAEVPALIPHL
jgi:protein-S-isoprenylcysteine O-methyltransferase Ste14